MRRGAEESSRRVSLLTHVGEDGAGLVWIDELAHDESGEEEVERGGEETEEKGNGAENGEVGSWITPTRDCCIYLAASRSCKSTRIEL